jgi:hypothetical protein
MFATLPAALIPAIVVLHGLGHGGAIAALAWIAARPDSNSGAWSAAHSWLAPGLPAAPASAIAIAFWVVALACFVLAGLGMAGIGTVDGWRTLAGIGVAVSTTGIVLFMGNWPAFNTIAALMVNAAIVVLLVRS